MRPGDPAELATIMALALYSEWLLARRPIAEVSRALRVPLAGTPHTESTTSHPPLPEWAQRRVSLTLLAMRHWPRQDMCLRRSLVLGHRLAALDPQLVLGVRPGGETIDAHAWVRVNGVDLDPQSRSYLPFEFA